MKSEEDVHSGTSAEPHPDKAPILNNTAVLYSTRND